MWTLNYSPTFVVFGVPCGTLFESRGSTYTSGAPLPDYTALCAYLTTSSVYFYSSPVTKPDSRTWLWGYLVGFYLSECGPKV